MLANAHATHTIVFNVKGEDLLYLDQPNTKLGEMPDELRHAVLARAEQLLTEVQA